MNKVKKSNWATVSHNLSTTDLAANLFITTQTESLNKSDAKHTYLDVAEKVRETIEALGGTMPKNLLEELNSGS